jgi:hypothetical protein
MRIRGHAAWGLAVGLLVLIAFASGPGGAAAGGAGNVTVLMRDNAINLIGGGCVQVTGYLPVCDNGLGDVSSQQGVIVYDTGVPGVYIVHETVPPPGYQLNTGTYPCDATSDLLCAVDIGHVATAVGGIAELPSAARLSPVDAPSSRDGQAWIASIGLAALVAMFVGGAATLYARRSR